jgi:hypothetical protein
MLHETRTETGADILVSERPRYAVDTEVERHTFEYLLQRLSGEARLDVVSFVRFE